MLARRVLPLLALTAVLAACGGATAEPQTQSAAPAPPPTGANAVTISPFEAGGGEVVVATTRPETMLGDTAVAVHPEDPR